MGGGGLAGRGLFASHFLCYRRERTHLLIPICKFGVLNLLRFSEHTYIRPATRLRNPRWQARRRPARTRRRRRATQRRPKRQQRNREPQTQRQRKQKLKNGRKVPKIVVKRMRPRSHKPRLPTNTPSTAKQPLPKPPKPHARKPRKTPSSPKKKPPFPPNPPKAKPLPPRNPAASTFPGWMPLHPKRTSPPSTPPASTTPSTPSP